MSDQITAELSRQDDAFRQVRFHSGTAYAVLPRWRALLQSTWPHGWSAVQPHALRAMDLIADPRMLFVAARTLMSRGPKAPGPNKLTLEVLSRDELWSLCHALGSALRAGTYRPGAERMVKVPKASGRGFRSIVISNVEDRVVQKSAALVLSPVLDPLFDPLSFGFRPRRNREQALAVAEVFARQGYTHWVAHDLKDAFGRVPLNRLLDVFFHTIPCERLRDLLARILPPQSPSLGGIKQGGPCSALALEVYLSHFLDRPWRRDGSNVRCIRYADDLLLVAQTRDDAVQADHRLRQLATPAGMIVKASFTDAWTKLDTGDAEWLGFPIRLRNGEVQVHLGGRAVNKLGMRLQLAHTKSEPARRSVQILRHWVAQLGPTFDWEDRRAVCHRAVELARSHGFQEDLNVAELLRSWRAASRRWEGTRKRVQTNPAYLVSGVVTPPCTTAVIG